MALLLAPLCAAQDATAPSTPDSVTVLHATTRLVLVDVIVADKKGHFIPDLKPADFTVLEDGKTQRISAFNTHRYEAPQPMPPLQLPPNNYTNFVQQAPGNAVTIILVDALNTPLREQVYAHQGVVRFLKQLPPGQRVALFTLGDQLKLVQEFSSSSDQLIATAKALRPDQPTPFLQEAFASMNRSTSMETPASNTSPFGRRPAQNNTSMQAAIMTQEMRMRLTLASLNILARSLSGYSGRKNLLWLSGQFPFRFGPDFALNKRDGLVGLYM